MSKTRETGYYWVKYDSDDIVAYWHGNNNSNDHPDWCWRIWLAGGKLYDSDFSHINETRILNPDEKKKVFTNPHLGEPYVGGEEIPFKEFYEDRFRKFCEAKGISYEEATKPTPNP